MNKLHTVYIEHMPNIGACQFGVLSLSVSGIQEIRRDEQLQAQLGRDVHVRYTIAVAMSLLVVEILGHFFEHDAADLGQVTDTVFGFEEGTWKATRLAMHDDKSV